MFETNICVVGNVLTTPEWRRTSASGRLVTTFKVAAATRRMDRTTGAWVDGNGLRVRVSCWRDLAGGVASSVMVGDPVVVYGQIYTRDWVDAEGNKRTLYEMEAQAVGHNLARGRARFARNKPVSASEVEPDPTQPVRLGGEATEPAAGLPTGLNPSDPLRHLDDAVFEDSLGFDESFTGLAGHRDGGKGGADQADPWDFSGTEPAGGLLAADLSSPAGIGAAAGLPGMEGLGGPASLGGAVGLGGPAGRGGVGLLSGAVDLTGVGEFGQGAGSGALAGFGEAAVPGETADGENGDEDAEDEESADDAEAVEHRPEEEADDESGENTDAPKDAAKTRRRRRTPAGV